MTDDEVPEVPIGERFSHVYVARGTPTRDSQRFRYRLGAFCYEYLHDYRNAFATIISRELGVYEFWAGSWSIREFFMRAELRDVLDLITLIWRELMRMRQQQLSGRWLEFVERTLEEENLGYRVDASAGVHYFVDEEFEQNRVATIERLASSRYAAVLSEFESAHQKLDEHPSDTKGAVRAAFEAVEILSKLMVGENRMRRLTAHEINNHLRPIVEDAYEEEAVALTAANKFLDGLIGWVSSIHEYRHGQEVQEPAPPPPGLAVAMVSSGATYLRWLAELDQSIND